MEIIDLSVPEVDTKGNTDLQNLLNEYGTPAKVTEEIKETKGNVLENNPKPTSNSGESISSNAGNVNWQGNPDYYQSGKKIGQLKPKRTGPKLVYTASNQPASIGGDLITGAMFLALVNLLMPTMIAGIHNYFAKRKQDKLKWSDIALTKEQENKLAPIADMVAKQIVLTWSPTAVLIVSMLGLYGMQYAIARMSKEMENKIGGI